MKVLMFGWEFPPFNSGGLGTACYGLTKGLSQKGVDVTFVIPKAPGNPKADHVNLLVADNLEKIKLKHIDSPLVAYITSKQYREIMRDALINQGKNESNALYGKNLFDEVYRYAQKARLIAENEDFDVIHAHDWLTFQAGMEAKKVSGKPLIVHVHATEFDRTGGNGLHQYVYEIEKQGMHAADLVLAVSQFTKNKIVEHYGVPPEKVRVVHNAVEFTNFNDNYSLKGIGKDNKVVLFLGRITLQKGPDYFLYAAKKVLEKNPNARFIMAGSGDMEPFIINKAAEMGIADKFLFAGFLRGEDIDRAYSLADVYVMPSVSEPFGITPLEAMRNGTPVIISKQSGVSEVISHCLKVDFWDVNDIANKILAVLNYKELHGCMMENGSTEVKRFSWEHPAAKCLEAYKHVLC
jgi:glycogen synthase